MGCSNGASDDGGPAVASVDDANDEEPGRSCQINGVEYQGQSTYYAADGSGACSFPATPDDLHVVALNSEDFVASAACGACIEVDGPDGSVRARVVDRCPGCGAADIDLSAEAFAQIATLEQGRVEVSWRFVPCPVEGALKYHFKEGSNQWWTAVQVRNHRYPVASVEIKAGDGDYKMATRSAYNYFIVDEGGMGVGPYDFRVTDVMGYVVEDRGISFSPDTRVDGQGQFPICEGG